MSAHEGQSALRALQSPASTLDAEQLRNIVAGMAVGMLVVDSHGLVIDTNAAAEALLGLPRVEIVGRSAADARWQAVDVDDRPLDAERHPSLLAMRIGQAVVNFEMGVALIGGARRWLLVNSMPLQMPDGARGAVSTFVDIGKRRALQHNLTQQGRRLRAVLEGTRTATWQWNLQTGELQLDARWAEIVGLPPAAVEPASAATWTALVHPQDLPLRQACMGQHFDGEAEAFESEYRMRHSDGGWRWVRDRGRVASHSADGRPLMVLGTHEDITRLKEAEIVKSRHGDLMRALFELSPLGLQLLDMAHRRPLAVNASMSRITGYSREELLQGDVGHGQAAEWLLQRKQWFEEARIQGHFGPTEVEYRHKSGQPIHLVFQGVSVADQQHGDYLWLSIADVTERHAMERQLRDAASVDTLTRLANRSTLLHVLQQHIDRQHLGSGGGLSVFFLDLDRFKVVNDSLGHNAGDELLRAVARRLCAVGLQRAPEGEQCQWTVARLGGDEFVVVVPGTADDAASLREALAVARALKEPHLIRQQEIHAGSSIGIALWSSDVTAADAMLRDADIAMYEAKRGGRGRCVLFDDTMRARLTRAAVIENELRHAVARGQLQALYQPIVDLETGAMSSVEALMRWHHPELGSVSPNEFIPVAEESGLITMLGEWILRTSCMQWAAWQREDPAAAPATISVNLSREQVALGQRVVSVVREALAAARMPAAALQLEITEREVMKNPEHARELLQQLSTMGVKLAMDDFGTGTSSLGCLLDYPFDTIKIDKSFVTNLCRDPHVLAVAHATVNVIENLGMVSVAEGIEDPAEVAALQAIGCRYGQGFFFARPQTADALLASMA